MQNRTLEVDRFAAALDHPLAAEVDRLHLAILASNGAITEQVEWRAPSFCCGGVDRVTFTDHAGLLRWITADRAVLELRDRADVEAKQAGIVELVHRWVEA